MSVKTVNVALMSYMATPLPNDHCVVVHRSARVRGDGPYTYRSSAIPFADAERNDDKRMPTGLVVGVTFDIAKRYRSKKRQDNPNFVPAPKGANVRSVGLSRPVDQQLAQSTEMLVVMAITDGPNANFFGLVNADADGVCDAIIVPKEDVFFYKAFRNERSTSIEDRRSSWIEKARAIAATLFIDESAPEVQSEQPEQSMTVALYELTTVVKHLGVNPSKQGVQTVQNLLEQIDPNLKGRLSSDPAHSSLVELIAARLTPTYQAEHASAAAEEAQKEWPDLQPALTTDDILGFGQAIREQDQIVAFSHVRVWLCKWRKFGPQPSASVHGVGESAGRVGRITGAVGNDLFNGTSTF